MRTIPAAKAVRSLAIACVLFAGAQSKAADLFQIRPGAYGCLDPEAARFLSQRLEPFRLNSIVDYYGLTGRCFRTRRAQRWERIGDADGLLLLRVTPPRPGKAPLFFPSRDVYRAHAPSNDQPTARLPPTLFPSNTAPVTTSSLPPLSGSTALPPPSVPGQNAAPAPNPATSVGQSTTALSTPSAETAPPNPATSIGQSTTAPPTSTGPIAGLAPSNPPNPTAPTAETAPPNPATSAGQSNTIPQSQTAPTAETAPPNSPTSPSQSTTVPPSQTAPTAETAPPNPPTSPGQSTTVPPSQTAPTVETEPSNPPTTAGQSTTMSPSPTAPTAETAPPSPPTSAGQSTTVLPNPPAPAEETAPAPTGQAGPEQNAAPTSRTQPPSPTLPETAPAPSPPASPIPQTGQTGVIAIAIALAVIVLAGLAAWFLKRRTHDKAGDVHVSRALLLATEEITRQASTLRARKQELVGSGRGELGQARWSREIALFCRVRIAPILAREGLSRQWKLIEPTVTEEVDFAASEPPPVSVTAADRNDRQANPTMGQSHYSELCASLLSKAGWDAQTTADQLVLARKNGDVLILRCTPCEGAVDGASVLGAATARAAQGAGFAAVVSNAPFTSAACRAAALNGVFLLHHDDLATFSIAGFTEGLAPVLRGARA